MRVFLRLLAALVLAVAASSSAAAQSTTGSIHGTVRDDQNAVVPGATVTVRNVETGIARSLITEANGAYRFLNMPSGSYELIVELAGFSKHVRSGITLLLNQDAVVDVQIQPATVTETIEVRADAPLLNTTTPEVRWRWPRTRSTSRTTRPVRRTIVRTG